MFVVQAMTWLSEIMTVVVGNERLAGNAKQLASTVDDGIRNYAVINTTNSEYVRVVKLVVLSSMMFLPNVQIFSVVLVLADCEIEGCTLMKRMAMG